MFRGTAIIAKNNMMDMKTFGRYYLKDGFVAIMATIVFVTLNVIKNEYCPKPACNIQKR